MCAAMPMHPGALSTRRHDAVIDEIDAFSSAGDTIPTKLIVVGELGVHWRHC
jgi:hypothetical protein